jgi:hypothetical protein
MVSANTNTTIVGRLRIRSRASDPQLEQQRISRMMRSATLHPGGLPDSALLVVRRLADPLPSRLRAGPFDTQADPAWQRAVAAELEGLSATAARPAFGPVPAGACAVLFRERAEVLSSLALDWLAGTLTDQWWWRELLRKPDAITALLGEWIEAPQYVPAALELLSRRSRAVPFVQRLPPQAAVTMLEAVIRTHGLPWPGVTNTGSGLVAQPAVDRGVEPRAAFAPVPAAAAASGVIGRNSQDPNEPHEQAAMTHTANTGPNREYSRPSPWMPWVPEASTPILSPVQKLLLVEALMLRRAPAAARTAAFQHALQQWQAHAEREPWAGSEPVPRKPEHFSGTGSPAEPAAPRHAKADPHAFKGAGSEIVPSPGPVRTPALPTEAPTLTPPAAHGEKDSDSGVGKAPPRAPSAVQPDAPDPPAGRELSREQGVAPIAEVQPERPVEPATSVETAYGGVFFLLNMALYLSIYGDFTTPAEMGLELNIWDFLSLMAVQLTAGEIEGDPLWETLALLAGRTASQRPGSSFEPPDEWRLPLQWLEPFPEDFDSRPVLRNGRMVSVHPAGFTVLDVPVTAPEPVAPADRLQRWMGWMAEYFRARLVRAMGRENAVELLCRVPARVTFALTHVDVFYSLNRHPIEVRMAGLDRDPGWIPAAGRYLTFHFH